MFDGKAFGQEVVAAVKSHVDKSLAPIMARIGAIEAKMGAFDSLEAVKGDIESVRNAVAALPVPKDGKDGADGKSVKVEDVAPLISAEVTKAVAAIPVAKDGAAGRDGVDGKDGLPGDRGADGQNGRDGEKGESGEKGIGFSDAVIDHEGRLVLTSTDGRTKELPVVVGKDGRDGRDGVDGKSVDMAEVESLIEASVSRAVAALPAPERGEKGEPGVAGEPGQAGRDGIDGKDGAPGKDGMAGKDGAPGLNGKDGADGLNGKDGVGAAGALINRDGNLVLTLTDGTQRELGIVVGKDGASGRDGIDGKSGADGKDGRDGVNGEKGIDGKDGINGKDGTDGVGFDDVEETLEDDGRFIVRRFFRNGIAVAEKRHQTKMPIWRNVFDVKRTYLPGDMATWKGSIWHCNAEVTGQIGSSHWSLAVKKGRDAPEQSS